MMASAVETANFIVDQLAGSGEVFTKRMFGEFCLYVDGRVVGFICDDQLFIKITDGGGGVIREKLVGHPYPGSREYWIVPADDWDDRNYMESVMRATVAELPVKVKKVRGQNGVKERSNDEED